MALQDGERLLDVTISRTKPTPGFVAVDDYKYTVTVNGEPMGKGMSIGQCETVIDWLLAAEEKE